MPWLTWDTYSSRLEHHDLEWSLSPKVLSRTLSHFTCSIDYNVWGAVHIPGEICNRCVELEESARPGMHVQVLCPAAEGLLCCLRGFHGRCSALGVAERLSMQMRQTPAVRKHREPTHTARGPMCVICGPESLGTFACAGQTFEEISEIVEHLICLCKIEGKSQSACLS